MVDRTLKSSYQLTVNPDNAKHFHTAVQCFPRRVEEGSLTSVLLDCCMGLDHGVPVRQPSQVCAGISIILVLCFYKCTHGVTPDAVL